jgi:predicted short-subunit dehydrogenase-like oxidoreductase (DUF2520 family)
MIRYNISFAGAGRVAGALCRAMFQSGIIIRQIVSETESDGTQLAKECDAEWSRELVFDSKNQVVIVAVPDHRLSEVLASVKCPETCIVAHTAGSFGLEVFPGNLTRRGVFYPLQTFSEGRQVNFTDLPFLIETSEEKTGMTLSDLAFKIGGQVYFIDSERRKLVHLAAVFMNNFTNYMLTVGSDMAKRAGLSLDLFEPLVRETVMKALEEGPERSQTGPAIRNDLNTIEKHLDLLSFSPELQNLYKEITGSIINHYKER